MKALIKEIVKVKDNFRNLDRNSEVQIILTANKKDMWDAFHHLNQPGSFFYKPFEHSPMQNFYFFEYKIEDSKHMIVVKSQPQTTKL